MHRTLLAGLAAVLVLGSLTPGGGVLCAAAALAGLLHGRARDRAAGGRAAGGRGRLLLGVGAAVLAQAPWVVAGLAHPSTGEPAADARTGILDFSVRAESGLGRVLDTLGLGGMWNAQALPTSRETWLSPAGTVLLLVLAGVGLVELAGRPALRRATALGGGLALAGYLVALVPVLPGGVDLLAGLVRAVPAAGLLRDGHRWLAWPALAVAVLAGYAADRVATLLARSRMPTAADPRSGAALGVATAVLLAGLTMAAVPDLFGGLAGRLAARHYPADWSAARQVLDRQPDRARLLVLPWQPFRRFDWTGGTTVLDPAPRHLPREAVVSDALTVGGRTLPQEGRLARQVTAALADGRLTEPELRAAGIGWVLVERGTPGAVPLLPGLEPLVDGPDLTLGRLPGSLPEPAPAGAARRVLVVGALLLPPVGAGLLGLLAITCGIRSRRGRLLLGYPRVGR